MADVTYYFDSKSTSVWTDSAYMIDNILTNYASTTGDGDTEVLDGNTGPGTDLGTITKVELRAYGYGDGDDRIDLTPVFVAGDGDEHQTTPAGAPGWGSYVEITSDTNAPSPWTWAAVQALGVKVEKDNVGKGNVMYCAKVEIRVTYTPYVAPTVTTQAVNNILRTKTRGNDTITNIGSGNCSKRGICWNKTGNPTVADDKSEETDSFGTGAFSRQMLDLDPGTLYYVKAYAYNIGGYGYGAQVEVTTLPVNSEVLFPNAAGDETNLELYPAAGEENWEDVDEEFSDEAASFVGKFAMEEVALRDLYNLPVSSGSGTIDKIVVHFRAEGTPDTTIRASVKSNSTVTDGAEKTFAEIAIYEDFTQEWVNNPADSEAWEWSDIDSLQIGIKIWLAEFMTATCTQVYVVVYYTPLVGKPRSHGYIFG